MSQTPFKFNIRDGSLYQALIHHLPLYVQEPFSDKPQLNVQKLYTALELSYEAIYKWLRSERLSPKNVDRILSLAGRKDNLDVLKTLGRNPPTREDFLSFMFA